ncbi:MAG: hypothetical protein ACJ763_01315 [Bdellovibrionia bacterium]
MGLASVAALTGLVLNPFGAAPEVLQSGKPWFAFEAQGPVLQLVRVQKLPAKNCSAWIEAATSVPGDELIPLRPSDTAEVLYRDWQPWTEKDLDPIRECDDFPCMVKLNSAEVDSMKKTSEDERVMKFHSLILDRTHRYIKSQARKGYEFPGDPVDPWALFEKRGFKPEVSRPSTPVLFARKLNFAPDKMLTMHQVLDRRVGKSSSEAVVWTRDIYTDHYFDSWGEWSSVQCDSSLGEVVVIESLLSEMDLLKSKSIFAHAAFGKYRSAFEENGKVFLNKQFERLKKLAEKLSTELAAPKPSPSQKKK